MELNELIAYAKEKYQIEEQHKWDDFPGFSVLCHPQTGKWVALLMRQWDAESGTERELCDLKCGGHPLSRPDRPYLSAPIRMKGNKWVGVRFGAETEPDVVLRLFDRAIEDGRRRLFSYGRELFRSLEVNIDIQSERGVTIVLDAKPQRERSDYQDSALPFAHSGYQPPKEAVPERLRQLRRMFGYLAAPMGDRAKNFCQQARLMEDYEDDVPWTGDFVSYFPTYRDLNTRQLRGYFTWRTHIRRGEATPIATSAAYLYIYELLNGVGADSPEDSLRKLKLFEELFLDAGFGDARMRYHLRHWMLELAVIEGVPAETARAYADSELIENDRALAALRCPETRADEEVFSALCRFGGKKLAASPVLAADAERGRHLFSEAWRAAARYCWEGKDLFTLCFGERVRRPWYPLTNAVYVPKSRRVDSDYVLDESRSYHRRGGVWQAEAYEKSGFDRERLQGFLHETELRLRRYLKAGRALKARSADVWAAPYIEAVIDADRQAALEAARPKITLHLSGLEQIRREALMTQDSLLTEEEREEAAVPETPKVPETAAAEGETPDGLPLDALQIRVLRALLRGESPSALIRENRLTPSLVSDRINEALFETFGDTVLSCEGDELALIEDYQEDISRMLGGIDT